MPHQTYLGAGPRGYLGFPRGPVLIATLTITAAQLAAAGAVASTDIPVGLVLPAGAIFAGASFLLQQAFDGAGIVWGTGLSASLSYDQTNDPNRLAGVSLDAGFSFDGARSGGISIGAPLGGATLSLRISTPDTTLDQLDEGLVVVSAFYDLP